jgi:GNAT superfamily N-acetyltransferase
MPPTLRLACESDADILLPLMREYYAFDGHHFDPEKARAALLGLLREPTFGRVWLIFDRAEIIGYVVLCFGYSLEYLGRDAFLDEFCLLASHRRQGFGTQVLKMVEEAARNIGIRAIHLEVVRRNLAAGTFYRKAGFCDHDHHLMTKWLDGSPEKPGA